MSLACKASEIVQSSFYRPIADLGEIRLIHLLPGCQDSSSKCSIEHVNLESKPQYEALSYMWGVPVEELPIEIDNSTIRIRPNLWSALYHLRYEHQERIIWIDALCINQNDTNERNHQVNQMGEIYSIASRVVLWLGESDNSSSRAMGYVGNFYRFAKRPESNLASGYFSEETSGNGRSNSESGKSRNGEELGKTDDDPLHPLIQSNLQQRLTTVSDREASAPVGEAKVGFTEEETIIVNKEIWDSIPYLCFRPYWSRLWIVQEVVLATDVLIQCGNDHCNWEDFSSCVRKFMAGGIRQIGTVSGSMTNSGRLPQFIDEYMEDDERPYPEVIYDLRDSTVHRLIRERDARNTTGASYPRLLLALCLDYKWSACEDLRDRVFGFHNFATKCCREAVPVDYSLHISEISGRLVEHHEQEHHLPNAAWRIRIFLESAHPWAI